MRSSGRGEERHLHRAPSLAVFSAELLWQERALRAAAQALRQIVKSTGPLQRLLVGLTHAASWARLCRETSSVNERAMCTQGKHTTRSPYLKGMRREKWVRVWGNRGGGEAWAVYCSWLWFAGELPCRQPRTCPRTFQS